MGFWDFILGGNKAKEEVKAERISIEELAPWLLSKKKQIEKQEENYLKLIRERIYQLTQELEQELAVLKRINIDERKAEEKIKLVVKENLRNYAGYVEKLAERLEEISREEGVIEKINSVFSDFKKRSSVSFEKATFLIGKEIENVKESIKNFFKDLEAVIEDNKEWIEESKIVCSAEKRVEKLNEAEKIKSGIKKSINDYNARINSLKDKIRAKEGEIENIRKSKMFAEESAKKEEIEKKKEDLEREIYRLKEIIDFKSLANFFHIFEKEMSIIRAYKENFKDSFQKDNGEAILSLLKEAKLENISILKKIEDIREKKKEIEDITLNKTGLEDLEAEKRKTESEILELISEKSEKEKKYQNLDRNIKEITDLIKEGLIKINAELTARGIIGNETNFN